MPCSPPITAYIALGANLGDREKNIRGAIAKLGAAPGVAVVRVSSLIENPAVGGPSDSPPFLNAVVEIKTTLAAQSLLRLLLEIEHELGRSRRTKWEPRPIDLDLLLFGDQVIREENLVVPHPLMHERRFVLEPLAQIAPQANHPVLLESVSTLLSRLPVDSGV